MPDPSILQGDIFVVGNLSAQSMSIPDGDVDDDAIEADAGIDPTKLRHQHRLGYAQPNTAASTETRALYVCYGAVGSVVSVKVGSIAKAVGSSTVTVDVRKNGTTILSSVITLTSANTNRVAVAATVSVSALVAGDLLEVVITATANSGTLPTGVFVSVTVHEDANP